MREFFKQNKIFLAIIIGALIIGGAILISNQGKNFSNGSEIGSENCVGIPELPDRASRLAIKIIDDDTLIIEGGAILLEF